MLHFYYRDQGANIHSKAIRIKQSFSCFPGRFCIMLAGITLLMASLSDCSETNKFETNERDTRMSTVKKHINELLDYFEKQNDTDSLIQAQDSIDSLDCPQTASEVDRKTFRIEKLLLLFDVLNHLDKKLKPKFDFDDVPSMCVAPPPESGLPSGVDPKSIKDGEMRAKYEKGIAENQLKAAQYNMQVTLYKANESCMQAFKIHIATWYTASREDSGEIATLIDTKVDSTTRKKMLKSIELDIHPQPGAASRNRNDENRNKKSH